MPPKGERRKQQIIDTAKNMFMERGIQSTHIGQVCDELNIARGTVYQYFSNKKEILVALLDLFAERIKDVMDQDDMDEFLKSDRTASDVEEFVKSRIISVISIILSEPIIIKLIFRDIQGMDEDIVEIVIKSTLRAKSIIVEEIKKMIGLKVFRDNLDPDVMTSMLIGGVITLVYEYSLANKDILGKEVVNAMVENFLNGALKRTVD